MSKKAALILSIYIICLALMCYFYIGAYKTPLPAIKKADFISIKNHHFLSNGKPFFPIICNLKLSLEAEDSEIWVCPYKGKFDSSKRYKIISEDSCIKQIKNKLYKIKSEGFNTIKILNLGKVKNVFFSKKNTPFRLETRKEYIRYLQAMTQLIKMIKKSGLKAVFAVEFVPNYYASKSFFQQITDWFKNTPTIFAYELRAPYWYLNNFSIKKSDLHYETQSWIDIQKRYAPYQLNMIRITGIKNVCSWDPSILNADAIEYTPLISLNCEKIDSTLHWFSQLTDKTWMIDYTKTRINCQDKNKLIAGITIGKIDSSKSKNESDSIKPITTIHKIIGRLVNSMNQPIQNGVVIGWNKDKSKYCITTTLAGGEFNLKADFEIGSWMASAMGMNKKSGTIKKDSIPKINLIHIGTIKLSKLNLLNQ